jgi:hypothetical protein
MQIIREDDQQPQQPQQPQPVLKPVDWSWIAQRKADSETSSMWKLGFIAPDGAEVRVTFHQTDKIPPPPAAPDPSAPPSQTVTPVGQPVADQTQDGTFYITFFCNRNPQFFMKWDTSLMHEDSLIVWITITHGIVDFMRKAQPKVVVLDDLANGKLKMILRSVALDVAAANPGYELEQTKKHDYRSFFQIKKQGTPSAFEASVQGQTAEGDTQTPDQPSPMNDPQVPGKTEPPSGEDTGIADDDSRAPDATGGDKSEDPTQPQPSSDNESQPAFPTAQDTPAEIKQTAPVKKGLTIEIGKDYSVAVKDKDGNAIDRYRGENPADLLRWINTKGYSANRMRIVDAEQPSGKVTNEETVPAESNYIIEGNIVRVKSFLTAKQAALMNYVVNADSVRCTLESVHFVFGSNRNMPFKKALVELAFEQTKHLVN